MDRSTAQNRFPSRAPSHSRRTFSPEQLAAVGTAATQALEVRFDELGNKVWSVIEQRFPEHTEGVTNGIFGTDLAAMQFRVQVQALETQVQLLAKMKGGTDGSSGLRVQDAKALLPDFKFPGDVNGKSFEAYASRPGTIWESSTLTPKFFSS